MDSVADLHLRAMTDPAAKMPIRQIPDWLVRLAAKFSPVMRAALSELGKRINSSHEKARRMLGWTPRSNEEAIAATGASLLRPDKMQ